MKVVFAIPLKRPADEDERLRLDLLLSLTLDSISRQTRSDYVAVVCGHVRPDLSLAKYPSTVWIEAPFPPPASPDEFRSDKHRKRLAIADYIRDMAPLYYMALDGDDLVHRKCVEHVVTKNNGAGYYVDEGYALDFRSGLLAPIPGVWNSPFHQICGSSSIIYLTPDDFPKKDAKTDHSLFSQIQSHTRVLANASKAGRPLTPLPFRAAVYVVNNGVNISYEIVGSASRKLTLGQRIKQLQVEDSVAALHRFANPETYNEIRSNKVFATS